MGLFDFFKGKSTAGGAEPKRSGSAAKWAQAASDKRAQTYDRQEAINELAKLASADAAEALLKRFTFVIDPSITDQEEKDVAFQGIVAAGAAAIEPVRAFAAKAESLSWPMRILKELVEEDEYVAELIAWLGRWDTEYAKFIDPKLQLLSELEDFIHPAIPAAVAPFLEDVAEPARFQAASTLLAQKDESVLDALLTALRDDESVRVKNRIADGLVVVGWSVPDDVRDAVRKALPAGYGVDGEGLVTKR